MALTSHKNLLAYLFIFAMAFTGGFADAASFILVGTFSGHVTGNTVLSFIQLTQGQYTDLLLSLMALTGFCIGSLTGIVWRQNIKIQNNTCIPIVLQLFLITFAIAAKKTFPQYPESTYIFILAFSFSLGLQNGAYNHICQAKIHTTYISGTTTTLLEALFYTDKTKPAQIFGRNVTLTLVSAFGLGACTGAFMTYHFNMNGTLLLIPIIFISAILCHLHAKTTTISP